MKTTRTVVALSTRLQCCIFSLLIGIAPCVMAQNAPSPVPAPGEAGATITQDQTENNAKAGAASSAPLDAGAGPQTQAGVKPTAAGPQMLPGGSPPAEPAALKTECVLVGDIRLPFFGSGDKPAASDTGKTGENPTICAGLRNAKPVPKGPDQTLSGSGDLTVAVTSASLRTFREAKRNQPGDFVLFLNGVALINDARLIASEEVGTLTAFRFRIGQGRESQLLWSMLYADGELSTAQPLYAGLGWKAAGAGSASIVPERPEVHALVQVTTIEQLWIAIALVALTIGAVVYLAIRGDALRDAPLPDWWREALALKKTIGGMTVQARDAHMLGQYGNWYNASLVTQYQQQAEALLARRAVDVKDVPATVVGLALLPAHWQPLRATYSLSRTQLALWFTFTVAAGLFLWMLYGDLRRIDGSLLALLGISGATAGFSWAADRNIPDGPYTPSQGFLADLLTGFDERKQLHRYQAVIVNLLLLVVGIYHVVQQLSYPVFDGSWLIFLGISGTVYGAGKGLLETGK